MPFPNTKEGRKRKKRYQRSIKNKKVYEGLRRRGHSKSRAARIANAMKNRAGRKRVARKAARTRKRRGS